MQGFHKENTRIAKNTLIIYLRMLCISVIGLVAMRLVLKALGQSNLGLYDVLAGLIAMLGFLSTAMSTTTRRYINVEMGKPDGNPQKIFNILLRIHIGLAVLIFVLAESFGMWYIFNQLQLEDGQLGDAIFVFQVSTIVACMGIINIPFQSLMEAFEKFGASAAIDIIANLVKLALVCVLLIYPGNKLRFYALSMSAVTLVMLLLYHGYCARRWGSIIKIGRFKDRQLYKEILGFNNYTALSALAYIARSQGSKLLVNGFFGTFVNGAFAPAYQLENFSVMGVTRFGNAAAPQITQNYSAGALDRSIDLVCKISRFCALLMTIFVACVLVELDFVLDLWLDKVPVGASLLCFWTMISALVRTFAMGGTQTYEQATGKIKWFQIINSSLSLACLPLGWLAYKLGAEPVAIIQIYIGYTIVYRFIEFYLLKRLTGFPIATYLRKAYVKPIIVVALVAAFVAVYGRIVPADASNAVHVCGIAATLLFGGLCTYFIGLYSWERAAIISSLRGKFRR